MQKGHSLLLFFIILPLLLISCDEGGIVGSNIIDDPPRVKADTVDIPATEGIPITTFSGNETYYSSGWYNDILFGEQVVTGLINPSLSRQGVDSIGQNAKGYLKLHVDQVYGDQSTAALYDLVEIDRRWRASTWRLDSIPVLSNNIVASFEITDNDSLRIPLDDEWFGRYREHFNTTDNRDSLYRQSMYGLALVPRNQAKILSFESGKTELIIDHQIPPVNGSDENGENGEDEEDEDTEPGVFRQIMRATGYSVDRDNLPPSGESTAVFNSFENTLRLRFDVTEEYIGSKNLARAELVLYEDTVAMQNLPANHIRPKANALHVYLLDESETERAVLKNVNFEMARNESDHSFRLNLTSYINSNLTGSMDERDLHIIVRSNNGRIIPTMIHNETSVDRKPRILITSANPEK